MVRNVRSPGAVDVSGQDGDIRYLFIHEKVDDALTSGWVSLPRIDPLNLHARQRDRREYHLLPEQAPARAGALRASHLVEEPRLLCASEQRPFHIRKRRGIRGKDLLIAQPARVEHDEVHEVAETKTPVDVYAARPSIHVSASTPGRRGTQQPVAPPSRL